MTAASVIPFEEEHIAAVVLLHRRCLPESLAARFGPGALLAHYQAALASPLSCGFVLKDEAVRGFVFGSSSPRELRRQLFKHRPVSLGFAIVAGVLRHPSVVAPLVGSLRGPSEGSFDAEAAELTYLAVAPEARRSRAGQRLVEAFGSELARRDVAAYELSVEATNSNAAAFYEALGFRALDGYTEVGMRFLRLRFDLTSRDRSP